MTITNQDSVHADKPSIDHGRSLQDSQLENNKTVYLRHLKDCADCAQGPPLCLTGQKLWAELDASFPDNHKVESRLTADPWPVVDKWYADTYRSPYQLKVTDYGNAFVAEDGGDVVEASELFDTETLAIDAARKYAKKQEAFWYDRIQALDKRTDELELAEQVEMDASINERR